jgi:two-component system, NarL family, response regulator LiaR
MPIRVLLADDHSVVRRGLRMFLELDDDLEVVGEAENGVQAVELARELDPDVIVMDLLMPIMDGFTATETIRSEGLRAEVLAVTSVLEDNAVIRAIRAGAIGYMLKDIQADELCRAIHAAAAGRVQLSPQAAERLIRDVVVPDSPETLTAREIDVLRLVAKGLANKEIAQELAIGDKTVKSHVSSILAKLGLQSRTQAAVYAARIGLIAPDEVSERRSVR